VATWCAIGAIIGYRDKDNLLTTPIDLGNGVSLIPMPAWARTDNALGLLSWTKRHRVQKRCWCALYCEYEAESLGTVDPRSQPQRTIQESAEERLTLANLSLWLAKPTLVPMEVVLHFDSPGATNVRKASVLDGLLPHNRDSRNHFSIADLTVAKQMNESLLGLTRKGTVWTATRLLWKGLQERWWEARFLLEWVAMEALFGSEDLHEVTFRLSQRVAFFLAGSREETRKIFDKAKKGYGWRSKTAHGLRLAKLSQDEAYEISYQVEDLLQRTFCRVLADPQLVGKFDSKGREEFLDGLIFS